MKLYDISRPITPALAVWPGDTSYSARPVLQITKGDSVNLTTLTLSAHTGTHADAAYHFLEKGSKINQVRLEAYLGFAHVVDFSDVTGPLTPAHLERARLAEVERLLIRTRCSALADDQWPAEIVYPTVETAQWLASCGVKLFGTDCPSVDPLDSKTLDAHKALHAGGIAILEGLLLKDVPPGRYELIALPLALDGDGSPVRALLRAV
ncbi:MAG TPA: arylformamidase [Candidatus Bipolaricaulota bacterium]